ncbi:mechanosensitive ion channel domain-containing protein [Rubripirellula reticaptiva]|uniref:Mechanosensitive channel MscK n=1 Tax=Rubripirellula reticaptiva TaxID=2528013 RepID=A0A5C6EH91_9BACT|nr:mechanosensitive ion channel domain-containing protein [Rubripirellula reticaptiva]TWU46976.1 Mechanosensitive channel MscK precursor [Rubripirellula reticaptiva]
MKTWTQSKWFFATLLAFACAVASGKSLADGPVEPPTSSPQPPQSTGVITVEQIERAMAELEQSSDVAADVKVQSLENYRATLSNLHSAADSDTRLKALVAEAESVSTRSEQLKNQRTDLKNKKPDLSESLALMELEQLLPTAELQLSGFRKAKQDAEAELQSRAARRKEIRARMAIIQDKIAVASSQLKALQVAEPSPQSQALAARLLTRRMTLEKETPALEGELAKYDAEEAADLVRLQIEVANLSATHTEKTIALLQQRINAAREAAAAESVRMARREAISADPALKIYAAENQALAETAKNVAEELAQTDKLLSAATDVYGGLVRQFSNTRKKVDSVGLTSSVGALLRKEMTTLPDVGERRAAVADRQKRINDTQFAMFEYEEAQEELSKMDETIGKILYEAKKDSSKNVVLLESAARDLMMRKREYLVDLVRSTGQYFDKLIELDTVDQQIIKLESEYEKYIDQRVLWIRSGQPLTAGVQIEDSAKWLLSTGKWKEAGTLLLADARRYVVLYVLSFSLIGLLLVRGKSTRRTIRQIGEMAEKVNCRSIAPTLRGLWLTGIVSLIWPLTCYFIGWRLSQHLGESDFTSAIGQGLKATAIIWASIELIRQITRPKGVGESHFRWPVKVTNALRHEVKMCSVVVLPTVFITATLVSGEGVHERGDVQRLAFMFGMAVIAFGVFRLLRPVGVLREHFAVNPNGIAAKIKYLFPLAGISLPVSLALLAAAGYFYTAQTLFWRLLATCLFVATLVVMRAVLYRMLLLRRRHLSMEQSRERAANAKAMGEAGGDTQTVAGIVTGNKQADISAHSQQSRNLVSTAMTAASLVGMWMIWIGVLPALSMIGNYPLWGKSNVVATAEVTTTPMLPMTATAGTGTATAAPIVPDEASSGSVTLSDLALAILIIVVTVMMFRNGPGLLEISVLQQLPLEASVRYAITTLVSYVIIMVGTIAACSTIGLQWSQIQWLATALTFGLAFGLQEMFANFVAGLIILLERPIRVGDVVTVDDVSGVVSRIRIRATSITNWDRKEYVVPNKEFITGRLLNWTLSDKVNRIVVEVGLAYGADTELARELLLKAANDHPLVLKDPASVASFEGFGDNSLNLLLRAFLPSLDNRLQVITELHTAINRSFREAGLEIAFPQRDLHIRTVTNEAKLILDAGTRDNTIEISEAA